jgi:hypothetical protein
MSFVLSLNQSTIGYHTADMNLINIMILVRAPISHSQEGQKACGYCTCMVK